MAEVKLVLGEKHRGTFYLEEDDQKLGEMVVSITDNALTVYHTEIDPSQEGKGLAKLLLESMVNYAREHKLQVIPLCPYVHAQFKRHPELYSDLWQPA